tara:strand:+ start:281 stop:628 length:348 start_codon:yes stop_codon:yes gene_type:complete
MNTYIVFHSKAPDSYEFRTEVEWDYILSEFPPPTEYYGEYYEEIQDQICKMFAAQGWDEKIMVSDVLKINNEPQVEFPDAPVHTIGLSFTFDPQDTRMKAWQERNIQIGKNREEN